MYKDQTNEEWINHQGCNACVNTAMCAAVGNCVILSIDQKYPEYNKTKRKLIQKVRTLPVDAIKYYADALKYKCIPEKVDEPVIRLTKIEEMCIESLNKKR